MSENTKIEWADHTFNPWEGCQKVGPGCDHCYAEARNVRFGGGIAPNWGPGAPRRRTSAANWHKPLAWNGAGAAFQAEHGRRQRVFCASLADVFDNQVDPQWRVDLLQLIADTPELDWLLLTKRIGNAHEMLNDAIDVLSHGLTRWKDAPWPNVWIGATIVNQEEADRDIPKLLDVPAAKRFLSMEPLLGPVDLRPQTDSTYQLLSEWYGADGFDPTGSQPRLYRHKDFFPRIDWVIVGGESGTGARQMHPDWARSIRDLCGAAGVPFLFKQWGEWLGQGQDGSRDHDPMEVNASDLPVRVGKKAAGRLLDGSTWDGVPA